MTGERCKPLVRPAELASSKETAEAEILPDVAGTTVRPVPRRAVELSVSRVIFRGDRVKARFEAGHLR